MTPYWLLWAFFFLGALFSQRGQLQGGGEIAMSRPGLPGMMIIGLVLMTFMLGFRFEVGGDWFNYEEIFRFYSYTDLGEALVSRQDPGYAFLNWLAHGIGADVWFVNLACGVATVAGIAALARREPNPWLAVLLAIPYLVVVVGMGYTRQAAALGFVMIGLAGLLRNDSLIRYAFWVTVAALFHKSAIICLPLVAFTGNRGRAIDIALVASASIGLYTLFVQDSFDRLIRNYIDARYSSTGAAIRIFMSLLPGVIFLAFRERLQMSREEQKLWRNFSWVSIIAAVALAVSPSSTAVDRIALYLLPLQIVILARVPGNLVSRGFGNLLVISYTGAVLFTWLNFAVHSRAWIPYKVWFLQ